MKPLFRSRGRVAAAVVLVAACAGVGVRSWRQVHRELAVTAACSAASAQHFDEALQRSKELVGPDGIGRQAADCRCLAQLLTGDLAGCASLLESMLETAGGDWVPEPALCPVLLDDLVQQGRFDEATGFARRARAAYPDDADVFRAAMKLRVAQDGESAIATAARTLDQRAPPGQRIALARLAIEANRFALASSVLGDGAPRGDLTLVAQWYRAKSDALAAEHDVSALAELFDRWRRDGAPLGLVDALHGLALSMHQLDDPRSPVIDLLGQAVAHRSDIPDPAVARMAYARYVQHLAVAGRHDEALQALAEAKRLFPGIELDTEQVARTGLVVQPRAAAGALRFHAPAGAGGTLLVAADARGPTDSPYEAWALPAGGTVVVTRAEDAVPVHWVMRGPDGAGVDSGSLWPRPGATIDVAITPHPWRVSPPFSGTRKPADGRRRIIVVMIDGGDWRVERFLAARGQAPTFDHLVAAGAWGALDSSPAFTAAALDTITHPEREDAASTLARVHNLGVQLGILTSHENPFAPLDLVIPQRRTLFSVLGDRGRTALDLLYRPGEDDNENGTVYGPGAARRAFPLHVQRPLTREERSRFAELDTVRGGLAAGLNQTAAELDDLERVVTDRNIDFAILRIDATDVAGHTTLGKVNVAGELDDTPILLGLYRYVDARLATIDDALDDDDLLVLMSDHGMRTAMEHDRAAIFVVEGKGVAAGRIEGMPSLAGVPRFFADALGVDTSWPSSGLERRLQAIR